MTLTGKGTAPGIAVGRIFLYRKKYFTPEENFIKEGEEQSQLDRYLAVKKQAMDELEELKLNMQKNAPDKAEIFSAHQEILDDIVINEEIPTRILNDRWGGDWAIYQVYETVLVVLRKAADPLIAERAADFDDIRSMLLRIWYGEKKEKFYSLPEPVIIAAEDFMPSDTAAIDRDKVLGLLTEKGGATSHTAIIAKSYGIPAITGIQGLLETVKNGQFAAVNADEGTVILDPETAVLDEYKVKIEAFCRDRQDAETFRRKECRTADGVEIDIALNITGVDDEELRAAEYMDSAGLFRTEFLFMSRNTLPDEEEQFTAYRKILEKFNQKPVILRTLDIGGDKQLENINLPREENPFLGNRGLRLCFSNPKIFKTQIRAALRASVYGDLWLMLPMVGSIDDIRRAKEIIGETADELKEEGIKTAEVKIGIMIEIPSIALVADLAAAEVDFASIGSNDLCQYLCAADRMNSAVESYYQSYHPAMFRLIKETVSAFTNAGKPISICGELGGDPIAAPVLIGLDLRKLSMGEASVAAVKRAIASVTVKQCEEMAEKVLQFSTAAEIEEFLKNS